jgi:hypothetical protein
MVEPILFSHQPDLRKLGLLLVVLQMRKSKLLTITALLLIATFLLWPLIGTFLNSQQPAADQMTVKMPWIVLVLPLFVFVILPVASYLTAHEQWKKAGLLHATQAWRIDETGISVSTDQHQTFVPWGEVVAVQRTLDAYIVLSNVVPPIYFTVGSLRTREDTQRFESMAQSLIADWQA